jgi:hypothetical protein
VASFARLVLQELLTVLRSDWGDHDLSSSGGTHRVVIGRAQEPPVSAPFLYLAVPSRIDDSYGEAPLGEYDQSAEIEFMGFVPSDTLDTSERALDALDFQEELERKITVAHKTAANTTLYSLLSLLPVFDEPMGADEFELPDGMVLVHGTIKYRRITVGGF